MILLIMNNNCMINIINMQELQMTPKQKKTIAKKSIKTDIVINTPMRLLRSRTKHI